jgi:hypothetical protein
MTDTKDFAIVFACFTIVLGISFLFGCLIERIAIGHPEEYTCFVGKLIVEAAVCYSYDNHIPPKPWKGSIIFYFSRYKEYIYGQMQISCGNTEKEAWDAMISEGYHYNSNFTCWYNGGYIDDPRRGILWFGRKYLDMWLLYAGVGMTIGGGILLIIVATMRSREPILINVDAEEDTPLVKM